MASLVDDSIISDFVTESRDHLATVEPDFLTLEQEGAAAPQDVINRVFRAIHSIKGGAGFLAFEGLKTLSHAMEGVLMQMRDGKLKPSPAIMDILFEGLDRLKAMLDDIQVSDSIPFGPVLTRLNAILEGQGIAPGTTTQVKTPLPGGGTKTFELDTESLKSCLGRGMHLFHATAFMRRDLKDKGITPLAFLNNALSVGQLLDASIEVGDLEDLATCLEVDLGISLLFATVLEPDLAALALKLPEGQLTPVDSAPLKKQLGMGKKKKEKAAASAAPAASAPVPDHPETPAPQDLHEEPAIHPAGEAEASRPRSEAAGAETLRVRVDLLTNLMNQAGELVLGRNQLARALADHQRSIPGLTAILQNINQVTTELQEGIMQTRMQPVGTIFNRFPRVVRDLSKQLGKHIDLQIKGAEVELDKSIVELLSDPLTHLIRNCADHAIEGPADRTRVGKSPNGTILLHAFHEGGQVNIAITDDGRGIDPRKVLRRAIDRGLVKEAQGSQMSDREIINLIFAPGFSTAEQVSEVSGRGVGMDVVRTNVEKLGGHVEVESQVGTGTSVLLRLPLTLAIIPSMIVGVEGHRFAIPQVNVVEFVWVRASEVSRRIERIQGAHVLRLRDQLLPIVRLSEILGLGTTFKDPATGERLPERRDGLTDRRTELEEVVDGARHRQGDRRHDWRSDHNIVVLRVGPNHFGVVVDELYDFEEIVVKPLSSFTQAIKSFSGATIMGDGRVIMILDAGGLIAEAGLHFVDLQEEERRRQEEERKAASLAARRRRSIILCTGGDNEYFAIPQERVMRLERVLRRDIQRVGEREYVDYRGSGLPLLRLDRFLEVKPIASDQTDLFVIIPKPAEEGSTQAQAGVVISNIIDAMDVDVDLETLELRGPGLLGGAILQHHLTLFVDPLELVKAAGI